MSCACLLPAVHAPTNTLTNTPPSPADKKNMSDDDAPLVQPHKRPRHQMTVEYRSVRNLGVPDVASTVRKWSPPTADPSQLIPTMLRSIFQPRVTVFDVLVDDLQRPFSLDNGYVLQELADHWLRLHRRGKPKAGAPGWHQELKTQRQPRSVWWEARLLRIWTWPMELRAHLVHLCAPVLAVVRREAR